MTFLLIGRNSGEVDYTFLIQGGFLLNPNMAIGLDGETNDKQFISSALLTKLDQIMDWQMQSLMTYAEQHPINYL